MKTKKKMINYNIKIIALFILTFIFSIFLPLSLLLLPSIYALIFGLAIASALIFLINKSQKYDSYIIYIMFVAIVGLITGFIILDYII